MLGSGAFAEFAIADEHQVGLKPANLTFAQAGVVPLVGLTNLESFYAAGAPWYNQTNVTVVVTSGQGGTGHIAVPMAKALGARTVISTASTANVEWVKSLGADIVVDFTKESVWSVLPDDSVDVVYDNIGYVLRHSAGLRCFARSCNRVALRALHGYRGF